MKSKEVISEPKTLLANSYEPIANFKSIPHFSDCHVAVRVSGHSMYPKYCNGDIIVCKRIFNHNYIPYGEPHLVVLSDCYVLKFIHPHPADKTMFVLKSVNEKFEPMEIKRSDVLEVYMVRGKFELT
jgi:repressor LexA